MSRSELKARARAQLGGGIFKEAWLMAVLLVLVLGALTGSAATATVGVAAIILVGPLSYGSNYAFLKTAREGGSINMGDLFKGFTADFSQTFLIGLMTTIFTALWSLLFVIPGIVKAYAYSLAYYIKVDHPEYGWRECIQQSQSMMNGHKMELFVLDLSFLGWLIVGAFCFGIGELWVSAYMEAAHAQFYEGLLAAPRYIND